MAHFFDQGDRDHFFRNTYQPITQRSGTQYHGFTTSDLTAYTSSVSLYKYTPCMSKAESTRQLTGFLAYQWPNHKARDALSSMREVMWTPGWGPDILKRPVMVSLYSQPLSQLNQSRRRQRNQIRDGDPMILGSLTVLGMCMHSSIELGVLRI